MTEMKQKIIDLLAFLFSKLLLKIYEKFYNEQLLPCVNRSISELMSAYRSGYKTNHALVRLIENWTHALDNTLFTSAVLMDLSKAFDCIPHNLLIAKLYACGLDFNTVTFLHNYLKHRKQSVKINNISSFSELYIRVYHKRQYWVRSCSTFL